MSAPPDLGPDSDARRRLDLDEVDRPRTHLAAQPLLTRRTALLPKKALQLFDQVVSAHYVV
jgi:hypothetical protein